LRGWNVHAKIFGSPARLKGQGLKRRSETKVLRAREKG